MDAAERTIEVISGKVRLASVGDALRLSVGDGTAELSIAEARVVATALAEAAAVLDGIDPEEHDWKRLSMQYLHLLVEADPEFKSKERRARTAVVHCWIKDQTRTNAFHVAHGWVNDDGWILTRVTDHRPAFRKDYEGTEYLPYYEQALLDDEVFLTEMDEGD